MEVIGIIISALLSVLIVILGFIVARLTKISDQLDPIKGKIIENTTQIENIKNAYAQKAWVLEKFVPIDKD